MQKVFKMDFLDNEIPDNSIDTLSVDPPYYETKGDFDFIWATFEDYLKDVEKWVVECKRILKPSGSLIWWGSAKNIAYSQIILDKYFNLENNGVWEKADCQTKKGMDHFNSFAPVTERYLFYSNYAPDINSLCVGGVRDYLREEIIKGKGKIVLKDINIAFGTASNGGGVASSVLSLGKELPSMITKSHYIKLRFWLNTGSHNPKYLLKSYEDLRKEYNNEICKNKDLIRYFDNCFKLTDVVKHSQQVNITKGYDHDTQKPIRLIKMQLQTVTRPGGKVCIPFGGSGTDVEACIDLEFDYICFEIDGKHFKTIVDREKECLKQPFLI